MAFGLGYFTPVGIEPRTEGFFSYTKAGNLELK